MMRNLALLSIALLTPACFVAPATRTSTSRTVVVEHSAEVHERNAERKEAHEERKEEKKEDKKEDHDNGKKP